MSQIGVKALVYGAGSGTCANLLNSFESFDENVALFAARISSIQSEIAILFVICIQCNLLLSKIRVPVPK